MISIAVTGGAACGKSAFCKRFEGFVSGDGCRIFSSDEIVAELLETPEIVSAIQDIPDAAPLVSKGRVEKRSLRKLVFENSGFRENLESILHPRVLDRLQVLTGRLRSERVVVLIEVPLLYEVEFPVSRDVDLVVAASPKTQNDRLTRLRGLDPDLARRILSSQLPIEEKIERGGLVVWNDGSEAVFNNQIRHLADRCQPYLNE